MRLGGASTAKLAYRGLLKQIRRWTGTAATEEILYGLLFTQGLAAIAKPPPLFPIQSAANYSLLYLILRTITELRPARTLELGAGQSTLLLDTILADGQECVSMETDEMWAEKLAAHVRHQVLHSSVTNGRYDLRPEGKFNFVIVDGPIGTKRHSRQSALPILRDQLADDFLVIFDDSERRGERDTIEDFLRAEPRVSGVSVLHGSSSQCVAFSEFYSAARYF